MNPPMTRGPVNEQAARNAAADSAFRDTGQGGWSPLVARRPTPAPERVLAFTVDDARAALEAP